MNYFTTKSSMPLLIGLLGCTINTLFAQSQLIKDYSAPEMGAQTRIEKVIRTYDDGYVVIGATAENMATIDAFIGKVDHFYNFVWARRLDINSWDRLWDVIETFDQGYLAVGYAGPVLGPVNCLILKFSASGDLKYAKSIDTGGNDIIWSIASGQRKNCLLTGYTNGYSSSYDLFNIMLDSLGNMMWAKIIDISSDSSSLSKVIINTSDSGYAIAGLIGQMASFITKLDADGAPEWTISISSDSAMQAYTLIQTPDNGFVTAECRMAAGGNDDIGVIKIDASGSLEWARGFDIFVNNFHVQSDPIALTNTQNGEYVIGGWVFKDSFGIRIDEPFIIKLNSQGNVIWSKTAEYPNTTTACSSILEDGDGFLYWGSHWVGSNENAMTLIKFDTTGEICLEDTFMLNLSAYTLPIAISNLPANVTIVNPIVNTITPNITMPVINGTVICEGGQSILEMSDGNAISNFTCTSTFFSNTIEIRFSHISSKPIEIEIFNVLGQTVYKAKTESTPYRILIEGEKINKLPSGIYFITIASQNKNLGKAKLIKPHR